MADKGLESRLAQLEKELNETRRELNNSPSFDSAPRGQNYMLPPYPQYPPNFQMPGMQPAYGGVPMMPTQMAAQMPLPPQMVPPPHMPPPLQMPHPQMPHPQMQSMFATPSNSSAAPDQFKQMLMHQAKLLEDTAQRIRMEQSLQQQLEYLKSENQHLVMEVSRARSGFASDSHSEEVVQLQREIQLCSQRTEALTRELAEATQQLRGLEQQHRWSGTHQRAPEEATRAAPRDAEPQGSSWETKAESGYTPVRTQVNKSDNLSQLLHWEEPVHTDQPVVAKSQANPQTAKVVANIQSKISDLEREHEKLQREYQRAKHSGNTAKEEELRLELDINETNLNRLRSKIKGYLD